jgi:hypothetical protein
LGLRVSGGGDYFRTPEGECLMSHELKKEILKEEVVTDSEYYQDIYLQGLRKIKKKLSIAYRDLNQAPPNYESRSSLLRQATV